MTSGDVSGTRPERDLNALSNYLMGARSFHADFVRQVVNYERSPELYHFTDLNGLNGVVSGHDLWLTNALYCNDEAEMKLGVDVARNQIKSLMNEAANSSSKLDYLNALDKILMESSQEGVYICCFRQDDTYRLSQWRAYGGNGSGVSLTIDPNEFVNYTGIKDYGFLAIWNVFYKPHQQEEIMKTAIDNTYNMLSGLPSDQIAKRAKDIIDFFVPTFKHEGFEEEHEWRMIFVPARFSKVKPHYRAAHNMLIPYYSLKDLILSQKNITKKNWRLPITNVCVGPSRHRELNRGSVQSLLVDNGYKDISVIVSNTPYRD